METKIKQIIADIIDLDEDEVTSELAPDDTGYWDSMNHLRIVTALEEEFGINLTMEEVVSIGSVGDIYNIVGKHVSSS